jgi:polar amino acid transport system substrate-binding protein
MPFSKLFPALKAGEVDMVISGMTITQERDRSLSFVRPYYVSGKGILAVAEKQTTLSGEVFLCWSDIL